MHRTYNHSDLLLEDRHHFNLIKHLKYLFFMEIST